MAGRIPNADDDELVLGFGLRQSAGVPSVPVYGIVGVLEQIGTGFLRELVHFCSVSSPQPSPKEREPSQDKILYPKITKKNQDFAGFPSFGR
jgi:hypothetical protein